MNWYYVHKKNKDNGRRKELKIVANLVQILLQGTHRSTKQKESTMSDKIEG